MVIAVNCSVKPDHRNFGAYRNISLNLSRQGAVIHPGFQRNCRQRSGDSGTGYIVVYTIKIDAIARNIGEWNKAFISANVNSAIHDPEIAGKVSLSNVVGCCSRIACVDAGRRSGKIIRMATRSCKAGIHINTVFPCA